MRYGCVITPDEIGAAIQAGFDYVELPARELDPEGNHEQALRTVSNALLRSGRPVAVEVFWGLLPPDLPVVGPNVDTERLRRYLHRAFTDMWALGGVLVVLASGAARRIPEGFPRAQAEQQFAAALELIQHEAHRNGLEVVLEPVSRVETNFLNTLDESCQFLAEHRVRDVRLMVDAFHLSAEGEPEAAIQRCEAPIAHVHVSDTDRLPPGQGTADIGALLAALRHKGYGGRMSIRATWREFTREAPEALQFVKQHWEQTA